MSVVLYSAECREAYVVINSGGETREYEVRLLFSSGEGKFVWNYQWSRPYGSAFELQSTLHCPGVQSGRISVWLAEGSSADRRVQKVSEAPHIGSPSRATVRGVLRWR